MINIERCWCGSGDMEVFSEHYYRCKVCNTLVCNIRMPADYYQSGNDASVSFYGKDYWTKYVKEELGAPDISARSRNDLAERCIYWLRALLKYKLPPAVTLELGCAHGGLVFLLKLSGYASNGAEMTRWTCDYAAKTFNVPIMCGRVEDLAIAPKTYDCILMMDVLEHLPDPVGSVKKTFDALNDDGLLVIQTPCWRQIDKTYWEMEEAQCRFISMLQEKEHLYLFNEDSIKRLLSGAGFQYVEFEPALFPYDMFVFCSKKPFTSIDKEKIITELLRTPEGRIVLALIDIYDKFERTNSLLLESEADRAARLDAIHKLEALLRENEADRAARLEAIHKLEALLRESEADRAARLEAIHKLEALLRESEADRIERTQAAEKLDAQVRERKADLAAALDLIQKLDSQFKETATERSRLLKEITEIKTSRSWKLTAPLRRLHKLFSF